MGVADWRAWIAQSGGALPTAPNPPGTPLLTNQMFPGVNPIGVPPVYAAPGHGDLVDGTQSIPTYPNTPTTVNAVDPFGGWTDQQEYYLHPGGSTMRPVIPGLTSP